MVTTGRATAGLIAVLGVSGCLGVLCYVHVVVVFRCCFLPLQLALVFHRASFCFFWRGFHFL